MSVHVWIVWVAFRALVSSFLSMPLFVSTLLFVAFCVVSFFH